MCGMFWLKILRRFRVEEYTFPTVEEKALGDGATRWYSQEIKNSYRLFKKKSNSDKVCKYRTNGEASISDIFVSYEEIIIFLDCWWTKR